MPGPLFFNLMEKRSHPWGHSATPVRSRLPGTRSKVPEAKRTPRVREKIRSGKTTSDRKLEFAQTATTVLLPEDRIEILCMLAADPDAAIRASAADILRTQP